MVMALPDPTHRFVQTFADNTSIDDSLAKTAPTAACSTKQRGIPSAFRPRSPRTPAGSNLQKWSECRKNSTMKK